MKLRVVKDLVRILEESSLSLLEIEEDGVRIRLEKPQTAPQMVQHTAASAAASLPLCEIDPASPPPGKLVDFACLREVKAPMVGVFYESSAPGAAPFVSIGSVVKKGDVLCILEAMKLMNEIAAEEDGEVVDICVANGEVVEYGQTMFKLSVSK